MDTKHKRFKKQKLVSWSLTYLFSFQHKYGYIRDKRSGVESYSFSSKGNPAIY